MHIFSFAEIKLMTAEEPKLASQYKRAGSSREIDMAARRLMIFAAQTPGYPLDLLAAHTVAAAEAKRLLVEHEARVTVEPNMDPKTALDQPIVFKELPKENRRG